MTLAWRADPTVLLGIAGAAALYALFAGPWRGRVKGARPIPRGHVASFALALVVLWLALESPLDELGDDVLFSAHMLQHLLLVLVVPVLLLLGLPDWMVRPSMHWPGIGSAIRLLTRPLVAFAVFNGVFAFAHLPAWFDLTLANEPLHAMEHLVFLVTALLLWWPVLSPLGASARLAYPLQLGYLFLQTLPCSAVAALITLSSSVLYQRYAEAPRLLPIAPLVDQQIGGLLMWIGGSLYFFLAMVVVFFVWAGVEEGPHHTALAGATGTGGVSID